MVTIVSMTRSKETAGQVNIRNLSQMVEAFAASEVWAVKLLNRIGVSVDLDENYDADRCRRNIEIILRGHSESEEVDLDPGVDMGNDIQTCRLWFVDQLEKAGLQLVTPDDRRASGKLEFRRRDGSTFRIRTYVSMKKKKVTGQVSFTTSYLDDEGLEWYGLIARPFGCAFLKKRTEVYEEYQKRYPRGSRRPMVAYPTFSETSTNDRLVNRISEMLGEEGGG